MSISEALVELPLMLRSTVSRGIKFKLLLSVDTRPHQRSPYAASLQYARMRRRQLRGTPRCTTEHLLSDRKGPAGLSLQVYPLRKRQRVVQVTPRYRTVLSIFV